MKVTKQNIKKPQKLGKDIKENLNVFTDSKGQKWQMPVGDLLKSQAKLQEMGAKNEQESMKLEEKRIEQQMAQMQADLMLRQQQREDALSERQDKANALNYGMAMYGMQGQQQLPQEQSSIFPSVLQSQGQMAQGQLGLIQQQMQGQQGMEQLQQKGQIDYQALMEEIARKYAAEMGIEKYRQGEETKRETERMKSSERVANLMYNTKDLKTKAAEGKLISSQINREGTTLRSELSRIASSTDMKVIGGDELDTERFAPIAINKSNQFLDSALNKKGKTIEELVELGILTKEIHNGIPVYLKGNVDSDDQDIIDILEHYTQSLSQIGGQ